VRFFSLVQGLSLGVGCGQTRRAIGPQRRSLTLVLERRGVTFRYQWRFQPDVFAVRHYGRAPSDEVKTTVVPGPDTRVASTRYEPGWSTAE
jgi:hypothetical protein